MADCQSGQAEGKQDLRQLRTDILESSFESVKMKIGYLLVATPLSH